MSTLEIIVLVAWGIGGLPVGVTMEILDSTHDRPAARGFRVLGGWVGAPVIVAVALVFGVCWTLGHAVGRVERVRPSREALEQQIRELEIETGVGE